MVKLLFLNLVILFSITCVTAFAETLTFHEDFESTNPKFIVTQGSGWGFSDSNEEIRSYNNSKFLQNNAQGQNYFSKRIHRPVIGAKTSERIHVPDQAKKPYLSFFYQSNLKNHEQVKVYVEYKAKRRWWWFWWYEDTTR